MGTWFLERGIQTHLKGTLIPQMITMFSNGLLGFCKTSILLKRGVTGFPIEEPSFPNGVPCFPKGVQRCLARKNRTPFQETGYSIGAPDTSFRKLVNRKQVNQLGKQGTHFGYPCLESGYPNWEPIPPSGICVVRRDWQ